MAQEGWGAKAQGIAALAVALIAVAAFFGIKSWQSDSEEATHNTVSAVDASNASRSTRADDIGQGTTSSTLLIEGQRASVNFSDSKSGSDARGLTGAVSIKIKNNGQSKIGVAWLDARRTAFLDLDEGTRLAGDSTSRFSGLSNCEYDRADRCSASIATPLEPGEQQIATLEVRTDIPSSRSPRLQGAETATFTASLVVFTTEPEGAHAKAVSLVDMPLINGTK